MKLPKKITDKWLEKHHACSGALQNFRRIFPNGAVVNVRNLNKALKAGLNIDWLNCALLGDIGNRRRDRYEDQITAEFDKNRDFPASYLRKVIRAQAAR